MTDGKEREVHPERSAFGDRVRELRRARDLSQEALADLARLHRTYISSLERGERNVGLDNVARLASALGVTVAELFPESDQ